MQVAPAWIPTHFVRLHGCLAHQPQHLVAASPQVLDQGSADQSARTADRNRRHA